MRNINLKNSEALYAIIGGLFLLFLLFSPFLVRADTSLGLSSFQVYMIANQTVGINVITPVQYDTVGFSGGLISYSVPTTTILVAGYYQIESSLECSSPTRCDIRVQHYDSSSVYISNVFTTFCAGTLNIVCNGSGVAYFNVGDKLVTVGTNQGYTIFGGSSTLFWTVLQGFLLSTSTSVSQNVTVNFATSSIGTDNPSQDIFMGFVIFFGSMIFIVWFFRRK
jgi:hypothetical protein